MRDGLSAIGIVAVLAIGMAGCTPDPRHRPIAEPRTLDPAWTFDEYVSSAAARVERYKWIAPAAPHRPARVRDTLPVDLVPPATCGGRPARGALLVHGLFDTAYLMRPLARHLNRTHCFHVRILLLPGHGTRPGDLVDIRRGEWIEAVRFGIRSFREAGVGSVHVGGFSLGGALALHAAYTWPDDAPPLAGVMAFAPALAASTPLAAPLAALLEPMTPFLLRPPDVDLVKYESKALRAGVETFALGAEVRALLRASPLPAPLLLVVVAEDATVDTATTLAHFLSDDAGPAPRTVLFAGAGRNADPRVGRCRAHAECRTIAVDRPDAGIRSLSHVGLMFPADDPHYGARGDYRYCLSVAGAARRRCESGPGAIDRTSCARGTLCYGERLIPWLPPAAWTAPVVRITFNPAFDALLGEISAFVRSR